MALKNGSGKALFSVTFSVPELVPNFVPSQKQNNQEQIVTNHQKKTMRDDEEDTSHQISNKNLNNAPSSSSRSPQETKENNTISDHHKSFLIKAVIIVGGGGLIFGYDIGVISGTLPSIKDQFNLDGYEEGLVVSILYAGSIVGSMIGGPICDSFGRWKTIQFQNVIFVIGALMTGLATNLTWLCFGRFFVGIASAISGLADVPYLTEIARPEYRGILSGQYEILVGLGILVSFCLDLGFISFHNGWRLAFLLPGILAFSQSVGLFWLPESPRWLFSKGYQEEAIRASTIIYGEDFPEDLLYDPSTSSKIRNKALNNDDSVLDPSSSHPMNSQTTSILHNDYGSHEEIEDRNHNTTKTKHNSPEGNITPFENTTRTSTDENQGKQHPENSTTSHNSIQGILFEGKDLLLEFRYAIIVIIIIQIVSQVTGANVIRNYAPTIFEDGGVSDSMALFYNVLLGVVKLVFTVISVMYIETTGRRKFFLSGILCVTFGMLFLTIASCFSPSGNLSNPEVFVIGCAFVYAGFGFSYGPIPWILSSEMVPSVIRGRVICISLVASNATQLIMNFLFFPMTEYLSVAGTFGVFLILNILTYYYAFHYIVETREIPPEEILRSLKEKHASLRNKSIFDLLCICCGRNRGSYSELCLD